MKYFCCTVGRRGAVRAHPTLNGIAYLEVVDQGATPEALRQRILRVTFVRDPEAALMARFSPGPTGNPRLVRITGGERVRGFTIESAAFDGAVLVIQVNQPGDYSTYTLHLHEPDSTRPLVGLDPELASVDFSFKVECPSEFDCAPRCDCPIETTEAPELDYLAKDYASFRQLILDRMSLVAPAWRERNPADLGIALVELMAYVGDYLSYRQDAVATEAYLGTARQRVSLRRHARLLDYHVHEGSNARVWVQVRLQPTPETLAGIRLHRLLRPGASGLEPPVPDETLVPGEQLALRVTRFTTTVGDALCLTAEPQELGRLLAETKPEVFEPLEDADLFAAHNELRFYTWSDSHCCLPRGATRATLAGHFPSLEPGMVLILAEVLGPLTGNPADADPHRRHPVRLTTVSAQDAAQPDGRRRDPVTEAEVTEIAWADADALPFALCISSVAESGPAAGQSLTDVSVAWGNLVLADHGWTILTTEQLPPVPSPNPALAPVEPDQCGPCATVEARLAPTRFRPRLAKPGLTFAEPFAPPAPPSATEASPLTGRVFAAASVFDRDPRRARPAVWLGASGQRWEPVRDLLGSDAVDRHFAVEIENDGRAALRFGDDQQGQQPAPGTSFRALYRIGQGVAGNVGANAVTRLSVAAFFKRDGTRLSTAPAELVAGITNPLPARGGTEAETLDEIRQYAPQAFRVRKRCVTPEDYATRAAEHPEVQRAAAAVRWTGSWHTIFLTVDRRGARPVDAAFETHLLGWLEPFRLAGHDLEINAPRFVSLELELFVCVAESYFRSDVRRALFETFSTREHADGSRGFFHPDAWTFGQPVWLSQVIATAQAIAGVRWVEARVFRRQGSTDPSVPDQLTFGPIEIARLDNDPNYPDHGQLKVITGGGR